MQQEIWKHIKENAMTFKCKTITFKHIIRLKKRKKKEIVWKMLTEK